MFVVPAETPGIEIIRNVVVMPDREELDEGLVITRGQEHCLAVYPMSTFVEMTREIAKGSVSVKKVRDYQRMLAAGASDTAADKQDE